MRCGLRAGWRDESERLCQETVFAKRPMSPQLVIINSSESGVSALRPRFRRSSISAIMVMRSTEDRHRCDAAYVLDGAMNRASLPRDRLCQETDESSTRYNKLVRIRRKCASPQISALQSNDDEDIEQVEAKW
jgi:hypothetical protein